MQERGRYGTMSGKGAINMTYLFLHGLGQTAASWDRVRSALALNEPADCPELASLMGDGPHTYTALSDSFAAYCGAISGPLRLCGLSLGGVLALEYSISHPEKVQSLVLIGTPYIMPKRLLQAQNAVFRLMPKGAFTSTGFQKNDFIQLCASMMDLDFRDGLGKLICPSLVVCGEKDRANRKAAVELAERLPTGELRIIEGAGHEVNTEAPEALAGVLRAFWN